MQTSYDYHADADILEVFFTEDGATAVVNLTPDIMLHFRPEDGALVSLVFNNFTGLVRPDEYGPRTFTPTSRTLARAMAHGGLANPFQTAGKRLAERNDLSSAPDAWRAPIGNRETRTGPGTGGLTSRERICYHDCDSYVTRARYFP